MISLPYFTRPLRICRGGLGRCAVFCDHRIAIVSILAEPCESPRWSDSADQSILLARGSGVATPVRVGCEHGVRQRVFTLGHSVNDSCHQLLEQDLATAFQEGTERMGQVVRIDHVPGSAGVIVF